MTETFNLSLEQAHAYEDLFVPALFAQWVPVLLRHAGVAEGQDVLDVACGTGVVARGALEQVGESGRVRGIDLNPAMIDVARECAPQVEWSVGDAADLPYDDDSCDAVVCQSALFFFPDPAQACREMARVLRPGGTLALTTPAHAGLMRPPDPLSPHVRFFTRRSLRALLEDMGFDTTDLRRRSRTLLALASRP